MRPARLAARVAGAVAAGLLLAAAAPAARGQPAGTRPGCLDSLPPSAMRRTAVYLEATAVDSAAAPALMVADLLVDAAAARIRASLGAAPGQLPRGDDAVAWDALGEGTAVTLYRDAPFAWRYADDSLAAGAAPPAAAGLLARALTALRDSGERMILPQEAPGDSARFIVAFRHPMVAEDGTVAPLAARRAIPVFSLAVPWESPVVITKPPTITYPGRAADAGTTATVILQFVVDSTGRVDLATVRDVNRPSLTPDQVHPYETFIRAARDGLRAARYEPARVGGCRVRQLVQQAFVYGLR